MQSHDIRFLNIFSLRGPSLWTYGPALEAWVDIGDLEDCPSNTLPGFVDRLCAWLPTLSDHRCSYGEPGGFIQRLHEGTWPAHILEHVTLELQSLAGLPGGFGKAREAGVRGIYKLVVAAPLEEVTRECLDAARELVMAAIEDRPFDVGAAVDRLGEMAARLRPGPSAACIVAGAEARKRKIPAIHLPAHNLVQLGYGARQRRIWAADTDHTGAIAQGIARDADLTHQLLGICGLTLPARCRVESADEAWTEAEEMGLPVVVKPGSLAPGEPGTPVSTREEMDVAWRNAAEAKSGVVVERIVPGTPHRLLVVGGNLMSAAPLDGGPGSPTDVTARIHPSTTEEACLAARIVGLDIAGIDVILEDVERPLSPEHGAIAGVHAGRGLIRHLQPDSDESRLIGRSVIDSLFAIGEDGRIPVVGITGSGGRTEVARQVAEFLRLSGKQTGLACGDGMFFNRRQVEASDCGNWQSGRRLLVNRSIEAAVLENSAEIILGEGLPYDRCQVGVVTRIVPESHYGRFYIDSPQRVFQVMRTQVDVVLPSGVAVLDATDPMAAELAPLCDGEVIFFGDDPELPAIRSHLADDGRAVFVRNGELILSTSSEEIPIAPLAGIPFLSGDEAPSRLPGVLASVATAWALGIALHVIRTGVETFSTDAPDLSPPFHPEPDASPPYSPTHRA